MSGTALERNEIITGLRELVTELRAAGVVAGIRLVGGAALALRYFDRALSCKADHGDSCAPARPNDLIAGPRLRYAESGTEVS